LELRKRYGNENVLATGHRTKPSEELLESGPFEFIDVTKREMVEGVVKRHGVDTIYHLAALLSAVGEKNPHLSWEINMNGLYNILEVAREHGVKRVFFPSSIGAFGPETPRENTPQFTVMRPRTMYGVTKVAGELLCEYYFHKFGLDVRGVRYPGIISSKTPPGGGTTDYAVAIFYEALKHKRYTCFVREDTVLPMMYMPDALKAAINLMEADPNRLKHRTFYNVTAMSFSAGELAAEIKKHIPDFICEFKPDYRQGIADSWPRSLDDSLAREEWGWKPDYDLVAMVKDMLERLSKRIK
jgi:nucleoside-diphosphate-sugar epimerase